MNNILKRELPSLFPISMFDSIIDAPDIFQRVGTTLPYDVVDHTDKDGTVLYTELTLALAGYKREDISLTVSGDDLLLCITPQKTEDDTFVIYRHKGISMKTVKLQFKLAGNADKDNIKTTFTNGLLRIEIPLIKKRDTIKIDIM